MVETFTIKASRQRVAPFGSIFLHNHTYNEYRVDKFFRFTTSFSGQRLGPYFFLQKLDFNQNLSCLGVFKHKQPDQIRRKEKANECKNPNQPLNFRASTFNKTSISYCWIFVFKFLSHGVMVFCKIWLLIRTKETNVSIKEQKKKKKEKERALIK